MTVHVGDTVIETTPGGQRIAHRVLRLDQPPNNPKADPGPYVEMTDPSRGQTMKMRPEDIEEAHWLEVIPQGVQLDGVLTVNDDGSVTHRSRDDR